jgi:1,4-dihydroxy-2-naphthoate octaprenyltransferase
MRRPRSESLVVADTVTFDVVFVLLIAAIALFLLSVTRWAKGWMLSLGLACFAAAVLFEWKL